MVKTVWGFLVAIFLVVTLTLPLPTAQTATSTHQFNETNMHAPPLINIFNFETQSYPLGWSNGNGWGGTDHLVVIYSETGNVSLSVWVSMPRFENPLYPTMDAPGNTFSNGYITSVSYQAGWQNNQTKQVYTNSSKNHLDPVIFNLTSVPYGYQTIHVYATAVITPYECATASTYEIPQRSEKLLNFTVAAPPTPTPNPQNTEVPLTAYSAIIIITVAMLAVIVLTVQKKIKKAAHGLET